MAGVAVAHVLQAPLQSWSDRNCLTYSSKRWLKLNGVTLLLHWEEGTP
jgi:hypothetical protein